MDAATPRDDRSVRLVDLLARLLEGRPATASELADEFGVTNRTVNRHLETLANAGIDVERDVSSGLVTVQRATFLRPLDLSLDEAIALLAAAETFGGPKGLPGFRSLSVAADKLVDSLPVELRGYVERNRDQIQLELPPPPQRDRASVVYHIFRDAVIRRSTISMDYASIWDGATISTKLDPYFLTFQRRAWYCVGHSHWHEEPRTFHLGRVIRPQLTGETFAAESVVSPRDYFGHAWNMIRGEERHTVRILFAPRVARNVADVVWHDTQSFEWHQDDSVTLTVSVDGLDEISWWILGYGDQATVLEPVALQHKVVAHARGMMANYPDLPSKGTAAEKPDQ